jgi:hypothetical protein
MAVFVWTTATQTPNATETTPRLAAAAIGLSVAPTHHTSMGMYGLLEHVCQDAHPPSSPSASASNSAARLASPPAVDILGRSSPLLLKRAIDIYLSVHEPVCARGGGVLEWGQGGRPARARQPTGAHPLALHRPQSRAEHEHDERDGRARGVIDGPTGRRMQAARQNVPSTSEQVRAICQLLVVFC